jgi:hypothetical protein
MYKFETEPKTMLMAKKKNFQPKQIEKEFIKNQIKKQNVTVLDNILKDLRRNGFKDPFDFNIKESHKIQTNLEIFLIEQNY